MLPISAARVRRDVRFALFRVGSSSRLGTRRVGHSALCALQLAQRLVHAHLGGGQQHVDLVNRHQSYNYSDDGGTPRNDEENGLL